VNTRWSYTYDAPRFTFVVRRVATGWLVDDEYCTGDSATTIYRVPIQLCPSSRAFAATSRQEVSILASFGGRPTLQLSCGIPNREDIVECRLSGRGFHPREVLRITYRLAFTALPRVHEHLQGKVYTRTAATDERGAFDRPPLRFGVVRYHESFRLTATAVGASGDRATITTTAIAQ
jgi:hypothetical protein